MQHDIQSPLWRQVGEDFHKALKIFRCDADEFGLLDGPLSPSGRVKYRVAPGNARELIQVLAPNRVEWAERAVGIELTRCDECLQLIQNVALRRHGLFSTRGRVVGRELRAAGRCERAQVLL